VKGRDETLAAARPLLRNRQERRSDPHTFGTESRRSSQSVESALRDHAPWNVRLFFVYTFLIIARPQEFFLPIPKFIFTFGILAFIAIANRGTLPQVLSSHFGRMFLGLAGLMLLSAPFGYWPSGCLRLVLAWVPYLMLFLMGAQVLKQVEDVRGVLYVLAASSVLISTMTIVFGGESLGRLRLSTGNLGNPNDLATVMLFCVPGWLLLWHRKNNVVLSRVLAAAGIIACVASALRTGSRSGLLALTAMSFAIFYRLSLPKKLLATVLGSALAIAGFQMLPGAVKARYGVMVGVDQYDPEFEKEQSAAIGSSDERTLLLQESIRLALHHPLLGVGPGQFPDVAGQDLRTQGRWSKWMNTHNAYAQIASEIGIPAFLIYLSILIACWRTTRFPSSGGSHHPEEIELRNVAFCIRLALLSFCINSFFTSIAYSFYVPVLASLAVGFKNAASGVLAPSPQTPPELRRTQLNR
jgi:O-antigen ligase